MTLTARYDAPVEQALPGSRRLFTVSYLTVLVFSVALSTWLTWIGVPCITCDHAVYHSPAVELITNGRMALPCFSTLMPQTEVAFGCYPPLFQLLLSLWYLLVGFSLRTSLAISFIIHFLNVLAIMRLTQRSLEPTRISIPIQAFILGAIGVIHVTNLSNFDRQEETALLWIWIEMLFIQGPGLIRAVLSGLMVGLAAVTSPWVGLLGALVLAFRAGFTCWQNTATKKEWRQVVLNLLIAALFSSIPMAIWAIYMEVNYPGILNDQFFGTMRYLAAHRPHVPSITGNLAQFYNSLLYIRPQIPLLLFTLVMLPCQNWRRLSPNTLAIYAASCLSLLLLIYVRPEAYTYLGAIQILLMPCSIPALLRYLSGSASSARLGLIFLVLFTLFAAQQAVELATLPWRWNPGEQHDVVYRRLREIIPPGDIVDTTGRYWDCFQGRNPWYEAYFLMDEPILLKAKWMVISAGIGLPPCIDAFELVEQIPSAVKPEQTYAYLVWRRRQDK